MQEYSRRLLYGSWKLFPVLYFFPFSRGNFPGRDASDSMDEHSNVVAMPDWPCENIRCQLTLMCLHTKLHPTRR